MILVFDLDDTLYDEQTYVLSGFKAVAEYVSRTYNYPANKAYAFMKRELQEKGRGRIFNSLLNEIGSGESKKAVSSLLTVYRMHAPKIKLYPDAKSILQKYKNIPKYVVTDGNKIVQHKKCQALNIEGYFKKIFITHRYGVKNAKPSVYCFYKILKLERAMEKDLVYIADNPKKDFINLKKNGFKTIRLLKGAHKDIKMSKEYEAHLNIDFLSEINDDLFHKLDLM